MFSSGNSVCVDIGSRCFIYCLQPFTPLSLTPRRTGTNINVSPTIPPCSARFPSPLLSLIPLPLPPSSPPLAPPQSTAGPPSLRPVSVLFHLACCYRGLDAGRLQLGSQSFSIYQSPRLPPHTLRASSSLSLPHLSLPYSLPSPASVQTTQQFLITPLPYKPPHSPLASHLPYLPLRSAQKM